MDWDRVLERNTLALLRLVGALFALLASARFAGAGLMVPRHVWRSILLVLRPAEAAARRLIFIAARTLSHAALMLRTHSARAAPTPAERPSGAVPVAPVFRLIDPMKRFAFDFDDEDGFCEGLAHVDGPDLDATPINAAAVHLRLRALSRALADLPAQAQRLARWTARRDAILTAGRATRISPIRPGLPPGWRERAIHEVDPLLRECHRLVHYLEDTS